MLGKTEDKRKGGQQRMRWVDSTTDSKGHKSERTPGDRAGWAARRAAAHGVTEGWTRLID